MRTRAEIDASLGEKVAITRRDTSIFMRALRLYGNNSVKRGTLSADAPSDKVETSTLPTHLI